MAELDAIPAKEQTRADTVAGYNEIQQRALDALQQVFQAMVAKKDLNARYLGEDLVGFDGEKSWYFREKIMNDSPENVVAPYLNKNGFPLWKREAVNFVLMGLAGNDSEHAMKFRRRYVDVEADIASAAIGLAGCESDAAWKMREEFIKGGADSYVLESLAGCDSDRAWEMREKYFNQNKYVESLGMSLVGLDNERAWGMRERLSSVVVKPTYQDQYKALQSIMGLDSERAWKIRESALKNFPDCAGGVAQSLVGLDSERAWKLREQISAEKHDYLVAMQIADGLAGLLSPKAEEMRRKLRAEKGMKDEYMAKSYNGSRWSAFAWRKVRGDREVEEKMREQAEQQQIEEKRRNTEVERLKPEVDGYIGGGSAAEEAAEKNPALYGYLQDRVYKSHHMNSPGDTVRHDLSFLGAVVDKKYSIIATLEEFGSSDSSRYSSSPYVSRRRIVIWKDGKEKIIDADGVNSIELTSDGKKLVKHMEKGENKEVEV